MKFSFRNIIAFFIAKGLLHLGPAKDAIKKAKNGEFIISYYFHKPSKIEFEQIIKWFLNNGFSFLSVKDLEKIKDDEIPFPKSAVILTVDDGWASNLSEMIPIAEKYNIPLCIFIATEAIEIGNFWFQYAKAAHKNKLITITKNKMKEIPNSERVKIIDYLKGKIEIDREAMKVEDISRIGKSSLITIGSHTHSHPILPMCLKEEVKSEIKISMDKLEDWTEQKIDTFAYPNGDFGEREISVLLESGIKFAFSNRKKYLTKKSLTEEPLILPRFGFLEGASFEENLVRGLGIWNVKIKINPLKFL